MKLRPAALVAACCAAIAGQVHWRIEDRAWQAAEAEKERRVQALPSRVPVELRRRGDCTFLTIPEWNLVFGPEEYADFMAARPPSEFPFYGQIAQFWDCYRTVYGRVEKEYPYNGDYHLMDTVIGVSTTCEYGLRGAYERTIGRIAEATRSHGLTAQDRLAAKVARDYVEFVKVEPWYKFDFVTPLAQVWTDTGYGGPDQLRQWERRYYLTGEYALKAIYAWLIKKGSESAFAAEASVTAAIIDRLPAAARAEFPQIHELQRFTDGALLITLPRYQAFMPHAIGLARHGVRFLDIAGNQGIILVSVLAPDSFVPTSGTILLSQTQLTRSSARRLVLEFPVPKLSQALGELQQAQGVTLEHVYDF